MNINKPGHPHSPTCVMELALAAATYYYYYYYYYYCFTGLPKTISRSPEGMAGTSPKYNNQSHFPDPSLLIKRQVII